METMKLEDAVDKAVSDMPKDFLIKGFLDKNKSEVRSMCLTEYDEEYTMGLFKKEYIEEGIEKGIEKGIEQGIEQGIERGREQAYYEMVHDGEISEEKAASKLAITIDAFKEAYAGWLKSRVSVV